MNGRYLFALVLLPAAAILFSGCFSMLSDGACDDKCFEGVLYDEGDYVPFQGCMYDERPCETGRCADSSHCATPTPTPVTCENSYPSCNGPCGNGTCRQVRLRSSCACCGDGVVDEAAEEECETTSDCGFAPGDESGTAYYECINCSCVIFYPSPVPTPTCGNTRVEPPEMCEFDSQCFDSVRFKCLNCSCVLRESMFPTPSESPLNATPTPTPTPYLRLCGNGIVNSGEQCDVGAKFIDSRWYPAARDTCPENMSCSNCACINRTVTARCGDCYISDTAHGGTEECDMGGTTYCRTELSDTCAPPLHCFNCKCIGTATPTPTEVPLPTGAPYSPTPPPTTPTPPPYYSPTPTEGYCGDGTVQPNEQCENSAQCPPNYGCAACVCISITPIPLPPRCGDGRCDANEVVHYTEPSTGYACDVTTCPQDCPAYPSDKSQCSRDCNAYKNSMGYQVVLGSNVRTMEACESLFTAWCNAAQKQCYVVCCYSSYTNLGGCCISKKLEKACRETPGGGCDCTGIGCE